MSGRSVSRFRRRLSCTENSESESSRKTFARLIPLLVLAFCLILPQPSLIRVLIYYYLLVLKKPVVFVIHLFCVSTLLFLAVSSLIICIVRDPGPVAAREDGADTDDIDISEALVAPSDVPAHEWCRKCWAPKPERAHHCSVCGRCVLRMGRRQIADVWFPGSSHLEDHHCAWLAGKCIGHRTYPAFIHFLTCITLYCLYVTVTCTSLIWFAFQHPLEVDRDTPVHALFLTLAGIIFTIVMGSFLLYHFYLITTNQTTLEHLSPFLLIRYLPQIPEQSGDRRLSNPPNEDELSFPQRRLVRDAHGQWRLYDLGWRENWAQVFGWKTRWGWVPRVLYGGGCNGNGRNFPRNPKSDELLNRLASELVNADKDL